MPKPQEPKRDEPLIAIGEISTTQGNRGEVRVFPLTDFPERFSTLKAVTWAKGTATRSLTVASCRLHKGVPVLRFEGYDSISAAEALAGGRLLVRQDETVALSAGHYYFYQIIGLAVYTTDGTLLGKVKDVFRTGSNDVYVVQRHGFPAGDPEADLLLPAIHDVVKEINPATGRMVVELLEGLV